MNNLQYGVAQLISAKFDPVQQFILYINSKLEDALGFANG